MQETSHRMTVTFRCAEFPIRDHESPETEGKALAHHILSRLLDAGATVDDKGGPIDDLGAWFFSFSMFGKEWRSQLNVAGLGRPIENRWALAVRPVGIGPFHLFKKQAGAEQVRAILETVGHVLVELEATDLEWWSEAEFQAAILTPTRSC